MIRKACLVLIAALVAFNAYGWHSSAFGWIVGIVYLIDISWLMGGWFNQVAKGWYERIALGLVLTLSIVSIVGTALFYLVSFSNNTAIVLLFLLPWLGRTNKQSLRHDSWKIWEIAVGIIALGLAAGTFYVLVTSGTNEAIRTPWSVVPPVTFLLYGLTAAAFLTLARLTERAVWLVPFYMISLSLLPLVYVYGYGFDPHIHQATEIVLSSTGTITPKPLYYLGQYTDVVWLSSTLGASIPIIDTWFLLGLAGFILPALFVCLTRALGAERPWTLWLTLIPLGLTLTDFTYTTPQGLSYLFALATFMLVALRLSGERVQKYLPWLTALAATAAQPITGVPLLGILLLWWILFEQPKLFPKPKLSRILTAIATVLSIPLAFTIISWLKPSLLSVHWHMNILPALQNLGSDIIQHLPFMPHYVEPVDATYLWGRPLVLLLFALTGIGVWYAHKHGFRKLIYFVVTAGLFASGYLILKLFIVFDNLAQNEQDFYSMRLLGLTLLALWPLAMIGVYVAGTWAFSRLNYFTITLAGTLILVSSFYLTYPRLDAWHKDTAYNTTIFDATAVTFVEREAAGLPYVALANQAVSAAAIKIIGFNNYRGGYYFYPLPTGSNPLYRVYLNAAQDGLPTREVVKEAARLANVPQVFLILNRYWADYDTLTQMALKESDKHWEVADGRLSVYLYDF